jgi:hypothetical protein
MTFKEERSYCNLKEEALHGTLRKEGTNLSSEYMMMMMMMTAYDAVLYDRYPPRFGHNIHFDNLTCHPNWFNPYYD